MMKVYSALDPADAHAVCGYLEAHGIEAIVQGEELWGGRGELAFDMNTAPSVWVVTDEDAERARRLIDESRGRGGRSECEKCGYDLRGLTEPRCPECGHPFPKPATWTCPACGEEIEEQFNACWKCGASMEDPQA